MSEPTVKQLQVECDRYKLQTAIDAATEAINRTKSNQERATYVRQAMDNKYGPAWSCVTGLDFGSEIPYLPENFAFFTVDNVSFLVCKSTENVKVM
ncbi:Dynein light chain 1 cytoplasmic [Taenia solium]|eukprot:TsM_000729100 transcript=TsM_000729100 gene=TsM_000729100